MSTLVSKIDMDNGNFPLAKDALKTLAKTTLSGAHRAIIDVVWMETYGWADSESPKQEKIKQRKTSAQISHDTFIDETWMGKSKVSQKIKELVSWNIIIRNRNTSPNTYSFNVNVAEWSSEVFRNTKVAQAVNSYQDRKQLPKQKTASCLPNGKQFPEQVTNSYPNGKQGVTQMGNSYPVQNLETQGTSEPLNKCLNNIKESSSNSNTHAQVKNKTKNEISVLAAAYHEHYGNLLNGKQAESLNTWIKDGLSFDVIIEAMTAAVKENNYRFSYLEGILRNWFNQNIRTFSDLEKAKERTELSKQSREPPVQLGGKRRRISRADTRDWEKMFGIE